MTIRFLKIPILILQDSRLSNTQKMLLGLIVGFGKRGCIMGNESIGNVLGVNPKYVSDMLTGLLHYELIDISNAQSRYRKIHFRKNQEVEPESTSGKTGTTSGKNRKHFRKFPEHIGKILKDKGLRPPAGDSNSFPQDSLDTDLAAVAKTRDATPEDIEFLRSQGVAI